MKKMIIRIILLASVVLLNCFQQIKAQTTTSTVSFTVERGTLTLAAVPLGYLEDGGKEQKKVTDLSVANDAAQPKVVIKGQKSLIVNDYRGTTNDRWSLYTQLATNTSTVIKFAAGKMKIILTKAPVKVVFDGQKNTGQTKSKVKTSYSKLQTAKDKKGQQETITWTLADTASSQTK